MTHVTRNWLHLGIMQISECVEDHRKQISHCWGRQVQRQKRRKLELSSRQPTLENETPSIWGKVRILPFLTQAHQSNTNSSLQESGVSGLGTPPSAEMAAVTKNLDHRAQFLRMVQTSPHCEDQNKYLTLQCPDTNKHQEYPGNHDLTK